MHYDVNVVEVTENGNSGAGGPQGFMDVVTDRLVET